MPRTLPPPYDRYGGYLPDCSGLPSVIRDAQEYLKNMQRKLTAAQHDLANAEQASKAAFDRWQEAANEREVAGREMAKAAGNAYDPGSILSDHPRFTKAYDALVKRHDAAEEACNDAWKQVERTRNREDEARAEARSLEGEVTKTQAWLTKLEAALAKCPPHVSRPFPGPEVGVGGAVVGPKVIPHGPPPDGPLGVDPEGSCADLEAKLNEMQEDELKPLRAELEDVTNKTAAAADKLHAAQDAWKDAETEATKAEQAFRDGPDSHVRGADGAYHPNPEYGSLDAARNAARTKAEHAYEAEQQAKKEWDDLVARQAQLREAMRDVERMIEQLRAMLAQCEDPAAVPVGGGGRVMKTVAALALTGATLIGAFWLATHHASHDQPKSDPIVAVQDDPAPVGDGPQLSGRDMPPVTDAQPVTPTTAKTATTATTATTVPPRRVEIVTPVRVDVSAARRRIDSPGPIKVLVPVTKTVPPTTVATTPTTIRTERRTTPTTQPREIIPPTTTTTWPREECCLG